jgi:hypothetical protein
MRKKVSNIAVMIIAVICMLGCKTSKVASNAIDNNYLSVLDEKYGQGKFNEMPQESGVIRYLSLDSVLIQIPNKSDTIINVNHIGRFVKKMNLLPKMVVVMPEDNDSNLELVEPIVKALHENNTRTIVVKNNQQLQESYYSTYKYARIHSTDVPNVYELDHNGITYKAGIKGINQWVSWLGFEYASFYPDEKMSWEDASLIIETLKKKGVRTFSICTPIAKDSIQIPLYRQQPFYNIVFIPSDVKLNDSLKKGSLLDVNYYLLQQLKTIDSSRALKIVEQPKVFYNPDDEMQVERVVFYEDEFVLLVKREGLGRNCWYKPDMNTVIVVDGKEYRQIKDDGFEDFSRYAYNPDFGYSNGSLCWMPEFGIIYNLLHFEPIPADAVNIDMVGTREYSFYGIQLGDDSRYDDVDVINQLFVYKRNDNPKTPEINAFRIDRVELWPNETVICLKVLITAGFDYKAHFGSDFELQLFDGSKVKALRVEGIPTTDKDYIRAGDHVIEYPRIVFPYIRDDKLESVKLSGTICHAPFECSLSISFLHPTMDFIPSLPPITE